MTLFDRRKSLKNIYIVFHVPYSFSKYMHEIFYHIFLIGLSGKIIKEKFTYLAGKDARLVFKGVGRSTFLN